MCRFYSLSQLHHVTDPSPLHVITTRAWEGSPKEHRAKQKWQHETHSITYVPGLSTFSGLSRIVAQPPSSFLCCLRPPSHHPSSLTSVSLVPVPHWLRQSTPFWPYGTHPSFSHALINSPFSWLGLKWGFAWDEIRIYYLLYCYKSKANKHIGCPGTVVQGLSWSLSILK